MDKRRPSEQLMDTRYHLFINAAQNFKEPQKAKEIAILLKECNMPCSSAYSVHYQRVGIIIKKGNLFVLNKELSRKEFEEKYNLMNHSLQKSSKKEKSDDTASNGNLTKVDSNSNSQSCLRNNDYESRRRHLETLWHFLWNAERL
jgi:hypothetical protein